VFEWGVIEFVIECLRFDSMIISIKCYAMIAVTIAVGAFNESSSSTLLELDVIALAIEPF
jgi:hypothetical protein